MNSLQRCLTGLLLVAPLNVWAQGQVVMLASQAIQNPLATPAAPVTSESVTSESVTPEAKAADNSATQAAFNKVLIPFNGKQRADMDYQQALRALSTGAVTQAQARLSDALKHQPLHVAARQLLATIDDHKQQANEAMQLLQDGVKLLPQQAVFNLMLARLYGEQGQAARGIALLEKLEAPDALRNKVDAMLAALYQRVARYDDAIVVYRSLLQRNPRQAMWWLGLALSLEASRRPANALSAYQQARNAGPGRRALERFIAERINALSNANVSSQPS